MSCSSQVKRTIRVYLSNTASFQTPPAPSGDAAAPPPAPEAGQIPSWALKIEGRLLDVSAIRSLVGQDQLGYVVRISESRLIVVAFDVVEREPSAGQVIKAKVLYLPKVARRRA